MNGTDTERVVSVRPRTVLTVVGLVFASLAAVAVVYYAWRVIAWVLIALFLAIALDHAVRPLAARGMRRGLAAAIVFTLALCAIAGLGTFFVQQLAPEVQSFVEAVPGYIDDLAAGRAAGPLGDLVQEYDVVDRVQMQIDGGGAGSLLGAGTPVLSALQGIFTVLVAVLAITFMTLFMLLEGPMWTDRFLNALPEPSQPRWRRILEGGYQAIGGWVTGALLVAVVAGVSTAVLLTILGVPFALPLGLLVAVLDPIPFVGATIGAAVISLVALAENGVFPAVVLVIFFIAYQQLENHLILPLVYGRTVQLSPLPIIVAVLVGGELAGIIGVIIAIPVAAAMRVVLVEGVAWRRERRLAPLTSPAGAPIVTSAGPRREPVASPSEREIGE